MTNEELDGYLDRISGLDNQGGDPRTKVLVRRIVEDLFRTIDELEVTPNEFWSAISLLTSAGQSNELGLLSPGLGFDHYLDVLLDERDRAAGVSGGTPRTIEGPLYVAGAPLEKGEARLDDGSEEGEILFVHGQVVDLRGKPVAGAIVDVWHADTNGMYSFFDTTQSPFNLRRRIETDADGRYRFRTIMPSAYGVPPGGPTEILLERLGRHGQRPAHVHFFVSAPGMRHLTTQINIADDPLLNDDFAFATRDGLIPGIVRHDAAAARARGVEARFAEIEFDFVLQPMVATAPDTIVERARATP